MASNWYLMLILIINLNRVDLLGKDHSCHMSPNNWILILCRINFMSKCNLNLKEVVRSTIFDWPSILWPCLLIEVRSDTAVCTLEEIDNNLEACGFLL